MHFKFLKDFLKILNYCHKLENTIDFFLDKTVPEASIFTENNPSSAYCDEWLAILLSDLGPKIKIKTVIK